MAAKLKRGVDPSGVAPQIWYAIGIADVVHLALTGEQVVVTSLRDGEHMEGSRHYDGLAADLRTRDLAEQVRADFALRLRIQLAHRGYDLVQEGDHLHVEWDPHHGEEAFTYVD